MPTAKSIRQAPPDEVRVKSAAMQILFCVICKSKKLAHRIDIRGQNYAAANIPVCEKCHNNLIINLTTLQVFNDRQQNQSIN